MKDFYIQYGFKNSYNSTINRQNLLNMSKIFQQTFDKRRNTNDQ